ncbi:alpha/beta hydrolase [Teredinibacter sp. KSP-S5-2]|uniref:alpha/beta hydrolase n=1 Tax=Teredinibacter sp. KSP-S5-2 TaxID=3034506 RepID=UPI00293461E9|nr:alpha/beta hydrolase-fold protein [Teredinibacter sp. KSP-S5-2]WNO10976.1 alpha/beta hydrolase-fold protein [Teredinibacter sp. KSP-S5-2]
MKRYIFLLLVGLFGCSQQSVQNEQTNNTVAQGTVINSIANSTAISRAKLQENPLQSINIYLPPNYSKTNKRYPVIYFLHGFGGSNDVVTKNKERIDQAIANKAKEFIFVEPNGNSSLGGSFYANSPAMGNWEDYIVKELIPYIDKSYRTINSKQGRGLAGFSMGGTGTINIGFKHPDKFNAIYSFAAGVLQPGDLENMIKSWGTTREHFNSYGAAASPNLNLPAPYAEIPFETYTNPTKNKQVVDRWYALFGNQERKMDNYLENSSKLSGIKISVNNDDYYPWIANGNKHFHQVLNKKKIEHQFDLRETGNHNLRDDFIENELIPFFSQHLE